MDTIPTKFLQISFVQKNEKSMPEGMLKVWRFAPKADRGGPELIHFNILLVSW